MKITVEQYHNSYQIVYVVWSDSGFSLIADKWQDIEEVKNLSKEIGLMETVGFVIDENENYLTLAQTVDGEQNQIRGGYIILRQNIVYIKTIKHAEPYMNQEKEI